MEEINEFIEMIFVDAGLEGIGCTVGMGLLWAIFFGGAFAIFREIINLLVYTI